MGEEVKEAVQRLARFVDGETPRTLYRCNVGGVWRFDAMRQDVAALIEEAKEAGQYTEAHERLDDLARERVAAAEAQVEAMRKALEEADSIFRREGYTTTDHPRPMIYAALSAPAEERSSSSASLPAHVADATATEALRSAGLQDAIEEAVSLADIAVTYDSVGRQYTHVTNSAEVAGAILGIVSRRLASSTPESSDQAGGGT